jgi:uncharacterized NAD(P)/FAD-binding protein YdhS
VRTLAIVGLGSWGLCVLERAIARAGRLGEQLQVHVVEPNAPGGGPYHLDQPDYLLLNNPCGQLSLYALPDASGGRPAYGLGLYEWAQERGYQWHGEQCRVGEGGIPLKEGDYLPRRLMGEYLAWFYETLVATAPANVTVVRHRCRAVDVVPADEGHERVVLDSGDEILAEHVVLTSGHTYNDEQAVPADEVRHLRPYPVSHFADWPGPGEAVAINGMGLVGYDLLATFTTGRGGTFDADGDRLRYRPSGREPLLYLFSRSGVPYCAKSATGIDPSGTVTPVICTTGAFAAVRARRADSDGHHQVDFRADLLPLLYAEMIVRFYSHAASLVDGPTAAAAVRKDLGAAWQDGSFDDAVRPLAARFGAFSPAEHLFPGEGVRFQSAAAYQAWVRRALDEDLTAALAEGGSPLKAALEVTRILRDELRSVIEFGGLSLESYVDFQSAVRSRINRIEAGPPPLRSAQLLALLGAGVVRIPFGPAPEVRSGPGTRVTIRSRHLEVPESAEVAAVIRGYLDLPSLARSASPLLRRLYRLGRLTQLSYGDRPVGSVAIDEQFHPFDVEGRVQPRLFLLGVLTEGARYFTHYLPSPRSRLRAVLDAQACVERALGDPA